MHNGEPKFIGIMQGLNWTKGVTQCDDFAAYLQEMSRKGFHFTEWKGGLVFEKGEPEDVTYQVEVFADGEEMDQRPSQDTEEYRDYCAAAGWKFLDGKARFCIFRKEAEDAPDILAPEERIRNICSVERKLEMRRIRLLFLFLLLGVFGGGGSLTLVFSNAAMVVETGFAIQILLGAGFLWVCLIAFGAFLNENRRPDSGERAVLADGQEIGISQLREDSSFLASDREYKISTEEGETVRIQIYETEQGWLAGQLWEKQEKEEEELYGPVVREEGLGESAWRRGEKAVCYSIKMDGKLFFAETEEAVPGEKIPLLRELLNLPLGR